jgi:hypothetical protein
MQVPITYFTIFPLKISYRVFLSVPPLPRCDCCPELHPPMPFMVAFSFLGHSGSLLPRSFISLLPHRCCFKLRSLMPLLHSGPFQHLLLNVCPFRVSYATLSWSYLLQSCTLHHDTFVLWVILLPAATNSLRDSQFP